MVTRDAKVGGTWLLIRAFARFLIDQIGSAVSEPESTKSISKFQVAFFKAKSLRTWRTYSVPVPKRTLEDRGNERDVRTIYGQLKG